jgi:hypothetical protein
MGLITMTYPDPNLNRGSYPMRPIPERRSSRYHHLGQAQGNNAHRHRRRDSVHLQDPNRDPWRVTEKTIGNPSEKDFAAHGIAVRDFALEAAEKWKRQRLREEGWETPGFEGEGESPSMAKARGKGKGKGKRVVRKLSVVAEESTKGSDEEVEKETVEEAKEDTTDKGKGKEVTRDDGPSED